MLSHGTPGYNTSKSYSWDFTLNITIAYRINFPHGIIQYETFSELLAPFMSAVGYPLVVFHMWFPVSLTCIQFSDFSALKEFVLCSHFLFLLK